MSDASDLVNLELIDAGGRKDLVAQILSKVKGLAMPSQRLVQSAPCVIAENVPRGMAEKLLGFLEKAGATAVIQEEQEEDLFSSDELELETKQDAESDMFSSDDLSLGGGEDAEVDLFSSDEYELEVEQDGEEDLFSSGDFELEVEQEEEEDLFSPGDLPKPASEAGEFDDLAAAKPDDWDFADSSGMPENSAANEFGDGGPSDDFGGFSAAAPAAVEGEQEVDFLGGEDEGVLAEMIEEEPLKEPGKFQQLISGISKGKKAEKDEKKTPDKKKEKADKKLAPPPLPKAGKIEKDEDVEVFEEEDKPKKKLKIPFLSKKAESELDEEETPKKKFALPFLSKTSEGESGEEDAPKKKFALPFLSKKPKAELDEEEETDTHAAGPDAEKKLLSSPVIPAVVGFLVGALLAGAWGWFAIRSTQRDADANIANVEQQVSRAVEERSVDLRNALQQKDQQINALTKEKDDLAAQLQSQPAQAPQGMPSVAVSDGGDVNALVSSFEELKNAHLTILENSYEPQKQAACAMQVLLDGESTLTYAQVVKQFSAKYTTYDIKRSDSLIRPYVAELKIPFQQEERTAKAEQDCNAAALQQLPTPTHHEFGSYYGYWTLEYVYQGGKWVVKSTVIERNRALYDKAFKVGSPEYAKFLLDDKVYPGLKN